METLIEISWTGAFARFPIAFLMIAVMFFARLKVFTQKSANRISVSVGSTVADLIFCFGFILTPVGTVLGSILIARKNKSFINLMHSLNKRRQFASDLRVYSESYLTRQNGALVICAVSSAWFAFYNGYVVSSLVAIVGALFYCCLIIASVSRNTPDRHVISSATRTLKSLTR